MFWLVLLIVIALFDISISLSSVARKTSSHMPDDEIPTLSAADIVTTINRYPKKYHSAAFQEKLRKAAKAGRLVL